MCTFVTMPLSYVVAVTKKKNHWWGHRPSNICPAVVLCPTGPKLGSKLILSLSLCAAISNQKFSAVSVKKLGCVEVRTPYCSETVGNFKKAQIRMIP
jgi:hypothetical protein